MSIADNKKAFFDYFIEERFEAGLVLEGWEVKAVRANRAQIKEGYVILKQGAFHLIGAHISALPEASTHVNPDPVRTRKLLCRQPWRCRCRHGVCKTHPRQHHALAKLRTAPLLNAFFDLSGRKK